MSDMDIRLQQQGILVCTDKGTCRRERYYSASESTGAKKRTTDWKQVSGIVIADVRTRKFLSWVICKYQQGIVDLLGLPCGDWGE